MTMCWEVCDKIFSWSIFVFEEKVKSDTRQEHEYAADTHNEPYIAIKQIKEEIPDKLQQQNLTVNQDKTEEYTINNASHEWKDLYTIAKLEPWSVVIKRSKLSWLGHLLRLPPGTPAQIALREALTPAKKPRGKPHTTGISSTKKDLIELKIVSPTEIRDNANFITHLTRLTEDKLSWNRTIQRAISEKIRDFAVLNHVKLTRF